MSEARQRERQPSRSGSWGPLVWLMAVIGILGGAAIFLWTQDSRRGAQGAEYSIRRSDDRGAALVYRLYERSGLRPVVWDQEFTHLLQGSRPQPGLMILIAPAQPAEGLGGMMGGSVGDILPHELQALDEWVKQGNVVAVLSRQPNDLWDNLGLIVDEPKGVSGIAAEASQPSRLAIGVKQLATQTQFGFKFGRRKPQGLLSSTGGTGAKGKKGSKPGEAEEREGESDPPVIPTIPAEQWVTLFVKREQQRVVPQVVAAARGKGLYLAVNDVSPASNLGVITGDNARFMRNLADYVPSGGTIWFDEFHKRSVSRGLMTYFRERALIPAIVYTLLLLGLFFWRTGVRFGPEAPLVADRRRDSGEYVRAVAALYQNAGMTRDALTIIYADFRRRLAGALRMDGLTDLQEVGRRYEARTGRPAMEAREIVVEAEAALARERLTEEEALQFCARLSKLDAALQPNRDEGDRRRKG